MTVAALEFTSTTFTTVLTVVALPVAVTLGFLAVRRAQERLRIGLLEALRLAILVLVLFALHQPELASEAPPAEVHQVVLVVDDTASMGTHDVLSVLDPAAAPSTRTVALAAALDDSTRGSLALAKSLGPGVELRVERLSTFGPRDDTESSDVRVRETEADASSPIDGVEVAANAETGTDLGAALATLLARPRLGAVVLLGDGDWNVGDDPATVAMQYRMRGVPISTVGFGSRTALPDIALLPLEPPTFALVGKPLEVPFAIESSMERDLAVTVSLADEAGRVVTRDLLIAAGGVSEGFLTITPSDVGPLDVTVSVPVQPGELDLTNNIGNVRIDVREESLRVLLIESKPRWEYRFLRNAMVRDPAVEVDCYLLHPDIKAVGGGPRYLSAFPSREALTQYDVVFLGDVGLAAAGVGGGVIQGLTAEACTDLAGIVAEQASGLILMPGLMGRLESLSATDLGPLLPVEFDPSAPYGHGTATPGAIALTELGRDNSLTRLAADPQENLALWESLPGFQWHAAVTRARPGAAVLAVHRDRAGIGGRTPLLVTKTHGTGKVLFMGTDGAWRWREGVEDLVHYRYWRQVVRWMAYQRRMNAGDSMRLFHVPDRPRVRAMTTLYANVMDDLGAPLIGAAVTARVEAPSGRVSRLEFAAERGDWGLYRASFRALEAGDHKVTLSAREAGDGSPIAATLAAEVSVTGAALEPVGRPARLDVLAELARITRGQALGTREIESSGLISLGAKLARAERPVPAPARIRLYSHPAFGGLILGLLTLFWIGRKLVGRF